MCGSTTKVARSALGLTDRNLSSDQRAFSPEERAYIKQVSADMPVQKTSLPAPPGGTANANPDAGVFVIEVNDNPSIDAGVEDAYLGEDLYLRIMQEFLRRLELKRLGITT